MTSNNFKFGGFSLNIRDEKLFRDDITVKLNPKTFQVLKLLIENAGEIVSKETFFKTVWQGSVVEDNNLTVAVAQIRKALKETPENKFVETVPKKGYRFIADVERIFEEENIIEDEILPVAAENTYINTEEKTGEKNGLFSFLKSRKVLTATVLILLIFIAGAFWRQNILSRKAEPFQSIAVMPFGADKSTPNNLVFAEKLTQELIFNLGRVTDKRVLSYESTAAYNSPEISQNKSGEDLQVDGIITGKIIGAGEENELAVTIRDLRSGETIFAKNYPLKAQDLTDSQYRLARDIAAQIGSVSERSGGKNTENLEAYQEYLEGRYDLFKTSSKDFESAIEHFTAAVLKDDNFADAHSALAVAHVKHGFALYGARGLSASRRSFPLAKTSALKTLEIKPDSDEALAALAFVSYRHEYDWQTAETNFRKALEINPNNLQARRWFGEFLHKLGRFDEGFAEQQKALALEPNSSQILSEIAWGNYLARRFDEAEDYTKKSLYIDKSNAATLYNLSEINEQKGNLKEAVELWKEAMMIESAARRWIANIEQKYQTDGRKGFARAKAEWLEDLIEKDYVYPTDLAKCYAVLGENDKAIDWLEKGIEARVPDILSIKYAPSFDNLKNEPRYQSILTKMNFPK